MVRGMTVSQIAIIVGGLLSLLMAAFHSQFFSLFGWRREFEALSVRTRKIIYAIHLALLLLLLGFACVSFAASKELSQARGLALAFNAMYSLFWLWRTTWQIACFGPRKKTNSSSFALHYILIASFALLCIAYALPIILRFAAT